MKKSLFVILAVLILAAGLFAGCAAQRSENSSGYSAQTKTEYEPAAMPEAAMDTAASDDMADMDYDEGMAAEEYMEEGETGGDGVGANLGMDSETSMLEPSVDRKIIYRGYVDARTKQFDDDYQLILDQIEKIGGYVENAYVYGVEPEDWQDEGRRADITVRVPSKDFDAFIDMLGGIGETMSSQVSGEDITIRYFDVENRLENLRIREDRLQELLKQAAGLEDIIDLERELANVSYEIQSFEMEKRNYDSLIDFSTISVSLTEVHEVGEITAADESVGERIKNGFFSVLNALADFFEWLLVAIIAISPVLIVLAIIAVIVIISVKQSRKKRRQAAKMPEQSATSKTQIPKGDNKNEK